ncbi:MAG: DNA gyrase inhibitor YacG [Gemmataceae bacterium]|nr:DNA gyrase inhibitor YacG [Gemmataceae bacterium]
MSKIRCPICDKTMDHQGPKEWPDWPFCCRRCRLVDLGRWLGGAYSIPASVEEEDVDETDPESHSRYPAVPLAEPHTEQA